jgi:hypothetical protein
MYEPMLVVSYIFASPVVTNLLLAMHLFAIGILSNTLIVIKTMAIHIKHETFKSIQGAWRPFEAYAARL